jgi:hypothetical protein
MERRFGFAVSRPTITIEGPFQTVPNMDAKWARATVKTLGTTSHVAVLISGPSETCVLGSGANRTPTEEELKEARARFSLAELARRSPRELEPRHPGQLAEIRVEPGTGPDSREGRPGYAGMWSLDSIRKHPALREYTIERQGNRWIARPRS